MTPHRPPARWLRPSWQESQAAGHAVPAQRCTRRTLLCSGDSVPGQDLPLLQRTGPGPLGVSEGMRACICLHGPSLCKVAARTHGDPLINLISLHNCARKRSSGRKRACSSRRRRWCTTWLLSITGRELRSRGGRPMASTPRGGGSWRPSPTHAQPCSAFDRTLVHPHDTRSAFTASVA